MGKQKNDDVPFMSRKEIEARAAAVLREHNLVSIPVNPITLAKNLGMAVHNAKFSSEDIVGMIAKRGTSLTLLVNQSDHPFRKRFTIAHELGHHFLHLLEDGDFVDGEANLFRQPRDDQGTITPQVRREIQANMFAAALLMPENDVRLEWTKLKSVDNMSKLFNVSEVAMGIRLDQLGLLDVEET